MLDPLLSECMTQGEDMRNAYRMAVEALGLARTRRKRAEKSIKLPSAQIGIMIGRIVRHVLTEPVK